MIGFWRKWFLLLEPVVVVIALGAVVYWSEERSGWQVIASYLEGTRGTLYSTLAGLAGSLLGFVIAALAITMSAFHSDRLTAVREHAGTLVATFSAATVYLGGATLLALLALLFDTDARAIPALFYGVLLSVSLSAVALVRCVWILHNVVSIVSGQSKSRAGHG